MIPYAKATEVVLPSGEATCVKLLVPFRGILNRLIVKQIDGVEDGFVYDIFDREDACSSVPPSSVNPDDAVLLDPSVHRVIPTQTVASAASTGEHFERIWAYVNQDEQDLTSRRPLAALYAEITPTGTGNKTFNIAWAVTIPEIH